MSDGNCVIGSKPHRADVGYVCEHHLERLARMLRDVEDEALHLDPVPSMQQRSGSGGGALKSERSPARLDVIAFLDPQTRQWTRDEQPRYVPPAPKAYGPWCLFCDHETCTDWRAGRRRDLHDDEHDAGSDRLMSVLGVLHGWARVVREDRQLTDPDTVTVTGERDVLSRNLTWCAAQPFIDEMYAELRQLLTSLRSMNGTAPDRAIGRCYLPTDDGPCNGVIRRANSTGTPWRTLADRCVRADVITTDGHAYCEGCGATWDGPQLAMLNWELEMAKRPKGSDGKPMQTAEEIATKRGMTVNAVRLRLSRNGARAVEGRFYDPAWVNGDTLAPSVDRAS